MAVTFPSSAGESIAPLAWWASLIGLCIILLLPMLVVDVPPLLDYPNHLVRLFLLAAGADDPVLSRFFVARWSILPDLGIDLIGLPLLWALPVHTAGRLIAGAVLLLPVLGTVAYSRAVFGRRSWWALGCGLVAFNQTFLLGFLNFTAGMGLALLLASVWLRWRETHPLGVLVVSGLAAVALFFCHLMGLLFYALLIGAHELAWLWAGLRGRTLSWRTVSARIGAGLALSVTPVLLYAASLLHHEVGRTEYLSLDGKLRQTLAPFVNYWLPLDLLTAAVVIGVVGLLHARGRLLAPARSWITLALVAGLYVVSPFATKGVFNLDTRFAVLFGFLLFACVMPVKLQHPARLALGGVIGGLFLARMAVLLALWSGHAVYLAHLRAVLAPVPAGARVLNVLAIPEIPGDDGLSARRLSVGPRTDTHLAALSLVERRAWWPFLFDNASQQPIGSRMPYAALSERVGGVPDQHGIGTMDLCGFTHVLLMGADRLRDPANLLPERLGLVGSSGDVRLFAVRPERCGVEG